MNASYQNAIKGYYVNYEQFKSLDNSEKTYHLPKRKQWGIEPCENETWASFTDIQEYIDTNLAEKQAVLCWQKQGENYTSFFIVWW